MGSRQAHRFSSVFNSFVSVKKKKKTNLLLIGHYLVLLKKLFALEVSATSTFKLDKYDSSQKPHIICLTDFSITELLNEFPSAFLFFMCAVAKARKWSALLLPLTPAWPGSVMFLLQGVKTNKVFHSLFVGSFADVLLVS